MFGLAMRTTLLLVVAVATASCAGSNGRRPRPAAPGAAGTAAAPATPTVARWELASRVPACRVRRVAATLGGRDPPIQQQRQGRVHRDRARTERAPPGACPLTAYIEVSATFATGFRGGGSDRGRRRIWKFDHLAGERERAAGAPVADPGAAHTDVRGHVSQRRDDGHAQDPGRYGAHGPVRSPWSRCRPPINLARPTASRRWFPRMDRS